MKLWHVASGLSWHNAVYSFWWTAGVLFRLPGSKISSDVCNEQNPSGEFAEICKLDWSNRHAVQKKLLNQKMGCGAKWSSGLALGRLIHEYGFKSCDVLHRRSVPNKTSPTEWANPAKQTTSRDNCWRSIGSLCPIKESDWSLRALLRVCCSWSKQRVWRITALNGFTVQVMNAHGRGTSGKQTFVTCRCRDVLTDWYMAQLDAPNILPKSCTKFWTRRLCVTQDTMTMLHPTFIADMTQADRGGMV